MVNRISLPVNPGQHPNQTLPGHGGNHPTYNGEVVNRINNDFGTQGGLVEEYLANGTGPGSAIRNLANGVEDDIRALDANDTLDDI